MAQEKLRRVQLLTGCEDDMHRPLYGLFEVLINDEQLRRQMLRAYKNSGRKSTNGALVVRYQPATQAQAENMVKHQNAQ